MILILIYMENGARGRTRTGTELPPRDFLTSYNFRCCTGHIAEPGICGLDFLFTVSADSLGCELGRSRQVSTLSRQPRKAARA